MRKTLAVILTLLVITAGAWAQDVLLGSHDVNQAGCSSCHAPHNALPGKGQYLWSLQVPTTNYNTYLTSTGQGGAGKLSGAALSNTMGLTGDTAGASILCMSCHDTTFSGMTIPGANGTMYNNKAIGDGGDLTKDHPVHVKYPIGDNRYWQVTVVGGNVTFNDSMGTVFTAGHPGQLFAYGTDAYLECASCHNPHSQTKAVVTRNGTTTTVATVKFLRGEYSSSTGTKNNFCMSCHAYMAKAWDGTGQ